MGLDAATIRLAYPNMADYDRAQNTVEREVTEGIDREQAGTEEWQAAAIGLAKIARGECRRLDGSRFNPYSRDVADFFEPAPQTGRELRMLVVKWLNGS